MATIDETKSEAGSGDAPKYKVIGTRPIRHDGSDKVTGRALYGADIKVKGMLYGATHRSPHAHAIIKSIDTSRAEALPGVRAVATSADMPEPGDKIAELGEGAVNLNHLSSNNLARTKVLYKGHPIAAVAADNIHIAQEAASLIEVEYEVLPPVLDVLKAMEDDAPVLNPDVHTEEMASGETGDKPSNIAKHLVYEKGDIAKGFADAKYVVEREFRTATVHQGYIEPHVATALWNNDGQITVWTSTQGTFSVRQQVAELLDVPLARVKVVPMEIGGGFGGKISVYLAPAAAVLSRKSGMPVQLVMDRADVLQATGPTPGSYIKVKMGADADGRITAAEAWMAYEAGGYPGSPIGAGCMCVFSCYDVPNGRVEGYDVCVNKPRTNAYRAPGATNAAFATETVVDELCEQIGMAPIDFRLLNASKEGTRRVDGVTYPRIGLVETLEAIKNSEHFNSPLEGENQGRGIACGFWFNAGLKSAVTATVNSDGSVGLLEGSTDIGGSRTAIAMQFAETLGIAAEDIKPAVVDTDSVGYTDVTGGSRVTYATGWAAYEAGKDLQRQIVARAAELWEVDPASVSYEDGCVVGPDKRVPFKEIAIELSTAGEPLVGRGVSNHNEPGGAFGAHVVDVEVDPDTGKVDILRYTAAQDCGTAIHPAYVEGQIQGGAVQGIGWGLNEEYWYDTEGSMRNANFLDYRIPTCYDLPMIETIIVEVPNPGHPYGVRGVGEVPIVPPPAALEAAIHEAVDVRLYELPMSPPRVLHELLKKQS
ncbi:xanthine dehydrogenase family protein molybdopterin-binding subunit [Gimesia panareensis]|uniref:4-hydroxybenzoyl-CoA reductase subunit alpha n=1 Tax=Gimesia panareensis TaxID=2527978 RepID=A0A517Q349_9PLAN|nr:xanthine dehydrogenase family protein molybdopterin-binding subunit [Gimesia panareensis]QDT26056.1 4-hydroxybenzoyl-CoA reductase subunit alpha [Gimesia panareensis]QDU48991.1 4-hydroxybenzoyl-CoA reductase subunit alpha [Gimesia panareensis]